MLITWVLIISLMKVCVQNYSDHLPPHLETPGKHVKREKEGKKEKLTATSLIPNEETQKQRLLKPEFISSKERAEEKILFNNKINNLAKEIVILPHKSKTSISSLVAQKTKDEAELHETKREIFPYMYVVQDAKKRSHRDVFKEGLNNEISHPNLKARTESPNFSVSTLYDQLNLVNGKQETNL